MELFQPLIHDALFLLAVVNPIGNIPIYVDLTRECERKERVRIINIAVVVSCAWLLFLL